MSHPDSSTIDSSCDSLKRIDDSYCQISPKKPRAASKRQALIRHQKLQWLDQVSLPGYSGVSRSDNTDWLDKSSSSS